jgi:hypothetical protein
MTTGFFWGVGIRFPLQEKRGARISIAEPLEKVRPRVYQMAFAKTKS